MEQSDIIKKMINELFEKVIVEKELWSPIRDMIRIWYCADTLIRKNFKNQDTIWLRYV